MGSALLAPKPCPTLSAAAPAPKPSTSTTTASCTACCTALQDAAYNIYPRITSLTCDYTNTTAAGPTLFSALRSSLGLGHGPNMLRDDATGGVS